MDFKGIVILFLAFEKTYNLFEEGTGTNANINPIQELGHTL